jgi:hypothetical protein
MSCSILKKSKFGYCYIKRATYNSMYSTCTHNISRTIHLWPYTVLYFNPKNLTFSLGWHTALVLNISREDAF